MKDIYSFDTAREIPIAVFDEFPQSCKATERLCKQHDTQQFNLKLVYLDTT